MVKIRSRPPYHQNSSIKIKVKNLEFGAHGERHSAAPDYGNRL